MLGLTRLVSVFISTRAMALQRKSKAASRIITPRKNHMNQIMTVRELSEYLRVHPTTVYRLLKLGKLPAFKVGSDWRFNSESIDRWRSEQDTFEAQEPNY
jgi:excisionase family DNA binding protein